MRLNKNSFLTALLVTMVMVGCGKSNAPSEVVESDAVLSGESSFDAENKYPGVLNLETKADNQYVGVIDFSNSDWLKYAYASYDNDTRKWLVKTIDKDIREYNNETVSDGAMAIVCTHEVTETVPVGRNIFSLNIGDNNWKNYNLSFDFTMDKDDVFWFTVYRDFGEVKSDTTVAYSSFAFNLSKDGLYVEPYVGEGGYFVKDVNGDIMLKGADFSVWDNIKLYLVNDVELHLSFNGQEQGVIYTYNTKPCGAIAFAGSEGLMIKKIELEVAKTNNL